MAKEEEYDRIIIGKDGVMFDGSRAMFEDCFFSNATTKNIVEFAKENKQSLSINGVVFISESSLLTEKVENLVGFLENLKSLNRENIEIDRVLKFLE